MDFLIKSFIMVVKDERVYKKLIYIEYEAKLPLL